MTEEAHEQFVDMFLAGEFVELELTLEEYGTLANIVSADVWIPEDERRFWLVTKRGKLLYRKEVLPADEELDVKLTLEKEVSNGQA